MRRRDSARNETFARSFTPHDPSGQQETAGPTLSHPEVADGTASSPARRKIFLDCKSGFAQQYSIPCLNVPPAVQGANMSLSPGGTPVNPSPAAMDPGIPVILHMRRGAGWFLTIGLLS